MKTAIARVDTAAFGPGLIPGWMILACSLTAAAPEPSAADGTQTVALSYTEVSHSVSTITLWGRMLEMQRSPFAKEPAFGSPAAVSRGILKCFGPTTNDVRFLWHRGERKLWLDLNRNGDLSDDPDGLFVSPAMASGSTADLSFGEFKSIPIARWLGGTPGKALGRADRGEDRLHRSADDLFQGPDRFFVG